MIALFENHTLRTIALGSAVLGVVSGALGSFAVLRKQSLLGDAISHAALPGIVLAFLLTGAKGPFVLLVGAALAGWLGTLAVMSIVRASPIKFDAALALVLSVFFGLGLVLLSYVQANRGEEQAGLESYLFGVAATMVEADVWRLTAVGGGVLLIVALFWKEFKLLSFDPEFAASLGLRVHLLDVLLMTLLVIAIVLGLETAGVVLMSTLIVAPAAAARQWTDRLGALVLLSGLIGAAGCVGGALLSYDPRTRLPTGPAIVLVLSTLVFLSLLLAPNRGLAWDALRHLRARRKLRLDAVLADLHALAAQHDRPDHSHPIAVLEAMSTNPAGVRASLNALAARGWAARSADGGWTLTANGRAVAERLGTSGDAP